MNVRDEIKNVLAEVFSEAVPTAHFKDRVHGRLSSTLYTRPKFDYSSVENQVELIKKVNFDPRKSFSIQIKKFKTPFSSKDPLTGKVSVGNEVWAVIRKNKIGTIMFRNSWQKGEIKDTDYTITANNLQRYYDSKEKNPDGTVDLKIGELLSPPGKGGRRKKVGLDLPTVEIGGGKWYIDEANEELIYAKNIKNKISFDDLKEEILEKVIDAVTVQNTV